MALEQLVEQPASGQHAPAFEALHHADLLHVLNPHGDVGLLTLWSPLGTARRKLEQLAPGALDSRTGRAAVISNLYGDGMYAMFCNLLFNPQVRHLVALGEDLGLSACEEIEAFLAHGTEPARLLGAPVRRVAGTARLFPSLAAFDERRLRERVSFHRLGKLSSPTLGEELLALLNGLGREQGPPSPRVRVEIPPPTAAARVRRPSAPASHQVERRAPLACWEELVVRTVRFGAPVSLRKGARLELVGARAVIAEPRRDSERALARYGYGLTELIDYEHRMLGAALPEGIAYTYGNRLRGHFRGAAGAPVDTLAAAIERLRADPESRRAYVSLWDNTADLPVESPEARASESERAAPCLVAIFFRRVEGRLSLSATYRSHNLLTAWLRNVYGLMAIQRHVAKATGMTPGPLTVVSHSLGLDPGSPRYELACAIERDWRRDHDRDHDTGKQQLREDPNGYFTVAADRERGRIVVEHRSQGVAIGRYEDTSASRLAARIAGDMAVSLVSHALWLGQELARAEAQLALGQLGAHNPRLAG